MSCLQKNCPPSSSVLFMGKQVGKDVTASDYRTTLHFPVGGIAVLESHHFVNCGSNSGQHQWGLKALNESLLGNWIF